MGFSSAFKVSTAPDSRFAAAPGDDPKHSVSNFLTVQSFTNFAAMTGAIAAAWHAMQLVWPSTSAPWVPYVMAFAWGLISVWMSIETIKEPKSNVAVAIFIAFLNSLVLAGAVVGTSSIGAAAARVVARP
jgi:hypothetical protein